MRYIIMMLILDNRVFISRGMEVETEIEEAEYIASDELSNACDMKTFNEALYNFGCRVGNDKLGFGGKSYNMETFESSCRIYDDGYVDLTSLGNDDSIIICKNMTSFIKTPYSEYAVVKTL